DRAIEMLLRASGGSAQDRRQTFYGNHRFVDGPRLPSLVQLQRKGEERAHESNLTNPRKRILRHGEGPAPRHARPIERGDVTAGHQRERPFGVLLNRLAGPAMTGVERAQAVATRAVVHRGRARSEVARRWARG